MNALRLLPFSYPWIIKYHLGKHISVLDIGCGDGSLMNKVNSDKKYEVTGVDLYKPSIEKAIASGLYRRVIMRDLRKIKFKDKSFDVVLASQVIEHLKKEDSLRLISKLEKIAKNKVILTTPKGFVEYDPFEVIEDNKFQEHKSGWEVKDLENMGYKVYGQGSGFIYQPGGLLYRCRRLKDILVLISFLLASITYFIPVTGAYIIAVKEIRQKQYGNKT